MLLTPGEWPWAYYMLLGMGIHVVLFLTGAGLTWGTDGVRGSAVAGNGGPAALAPRRLGRCVTGVGALTAVLTVFDGSVNLAVRG